MFICPEAFIEKMDEKLKSGKKTIAPDEIEGIWKVDLIMENRI